MTKYRIVPVMDALIGNTEYFLQFMIEGKTFWGYQ